MDEALEPVLTSFDERVLAALDQWTVDRHPIDGDPLDWRDAWDVARRLREYDVALVRRTLDGLVRFGYADANGWDHRRRWVAVPWKREIVRSGGASAPASPAADRNDVSDGKDTSQ